MDEIDFSTRDFSAKCSFYVLLKKRQGIDLALFGDYWRNVHGPVCSRLPGQYQYWQFHLSHDEGGFWQSVKGVEYTTTEENQFDGIAELTFVDEDERNVWFAAASILMDDEHNIFSKAVGYIANSGNVTTYRDRHANGAPNGSEGGPRFHVLIQKSNLVSVEEFRDYISNRYVATLMESDSISKLRVHLLEEHDNSADLPSAPGVVHIEPLSNQFQAALEISFNDHMSMEVFFASEVYAASIADQAKFVSRITPFPVRNIFTFVYEGKMTLSGQRGSSVASLIDSVGATNQLREDISRLMIKGSMPVSKVSIGA